LRKVHDTPRRFPEIHILRPIANSPISNLRLADRKAEVVRDGGRKETCFGQTDEGLVGGARRGAKK